jgi:hypothetical protein
MRNEVLIPIEMSDAPVGFPANRAVRNGVRSHLRELDKIRIARNLESHESVSLDVKDIPKLCCRFLDVLLA